MHPIFFVYDGFTKGIKNKHSVYRDKYYIKKFCECLEEDTLKIINFKSKQKKQTKKKKKQNNIRKIKSATSAEMKLKWNMLMMRNISKLEIMVILQVNLDDLRIRHIF